MTKLAHYILCRILDTTKKFHFQNFLLQILGPDCENGLPPWIGYQEEEALKNKILSLSKDKR